MPRNVEIKARLQDINEQIALARELCGEAAQAIEQEDVFFNCRTGRLKLRTFADGHGELIFYSRPDVPGPKTSEYVIVPTDDPHALRQALASAHGERAVVRKTRLLFLHGRTRIHLDRVDDLGTFLELEVVLGEGEDVAAGQREATELMRALHVTPDDLAREAYVDLLA